MKNLIGVMQGRLLPKYQSRYQAHPVNYWREEFEIAKQLGLDCIEFILDFNECEKNPLLSVEGIHELISAIDRSGVFVKTVCADYFMEAPLHSSDKSVVDQSKETLFILIQNASELKVTDIVIPCVDHSSLKSKDQVNRFVNAINPFLDLLEKHQINLSLETDLNPDDFSALLKTIDSDRVTVNYDIGNSASLGYDPVEELEAYGKKITDIHIKDRQLNGGSVVLGQGNADFDRFFTTLNEFNYSGPFIMQAYRDDEGVEIFKSQLHWIKERMGMLYAS